MTPANQITGPLPPNIISPPTAVPQVPINMTKLKSPYLTILDEHRPIQQRKPTPKNLDLSACKQFGMTYYQRMLVDTTWDNIAKVVNAYENFCTQYDLTMSSFNSVLAWIGYKMSSGDLQPSSAMTYVSYIKGHLKRISETIPLEPMLIENMSLLQAGLGKTPYEKSPANPVPLIVLMTIRGAVGTAARIALRLAARVDEMRNLTTKHITIVRKNAAGVNLVLVDFRQDTKTSKDWRIAANLRFTNLLYLENLPSLMTDSPLFEDRTIEGLLYHLKTHGYTGHSIKKLAADITVQMVHKHQLPLHCIPLALKHTALLDHMIIPTVTMGYLASNSKAAMLETLGMEKLAKALFDISTEEQTTPRNH